MCVFLHTWVEFYVVLNLCLSLQQEKGTSEKWFRTTPWGEYLGPTYRNTRTVEKLHNEEVIHILCSWNNISGVVTSGIHSFTNLTLLGESVYWHSRDMNSKENQHCKELKQLSWSLLDFFDTGGCREFKKILSVGIY